MWKLAGLCSKCWSPICGLIQISARIALECSVWANRTLSPEDVKGRCSGLNCRSFSGEQRLCLGGNKEQSPLAPTPTLNKVWNVWGSLQSQPRCFSTQQLFPTSTCLTQRLMELTVMREILCPVEDLTEVALSSFFAFLSHSSSIYWNKGKNQKSGGAFCFYLLSAGQRQTINGKRWARLLRRAVQVSVSGIMLSA